VVETEWDAAWENALTSLELEVELVERMLTLDHLADLPSRARWTPPTGLGPMPAALADRARALLARQIEAGRQVAEAASLNRRHQAAAQALRAAPPSAPVYLDVPA
jgi:hypothetical protein